MGTTGSPHIKIKQNLQNSFVSDPFIGAYYERFVPGQQNIPTFVEVGDSVQAVRAKILESLVERYGVTIDLPGG